MIVDHVDFRQAALKNTYLHNGIGVDFLRRNGDVDRRIATLAVFQLHFGASLHDFGHCNVGPCVLLEDVGEGFVGEQGVASDFIGAHKETGRSVGSSRALRGSGGSSGQD